MSLKMLALSLLLISQSAFADMAFVSHSSSVAVITAAADSVRLTGSEAKILYNSLDIVPRKIIMEIDNGNLAEAQEKRLSLDDKDNKTVSTISRRYIKCQVTNLEYSCVIKKDD